MGFIVILLTTVLGVAFGAFVSFFGGWVDATLSRLGDIFFSIPYILAAVVIMSVLSQYRSIWTISWRSACSRGRPRPVCFAPRS